MSLLTSTIIRTEVEVETQLHEDSELLVKLIGC